METTTKVLGGCYLITGIILSAGFAGAFASLSANFGGNFEEAFWMAFPYAAILGFIVAICVVAAGSSYA